MILGGEANDDQHDDNEDKADGVFFLEETFGSVGDFVTNIFQELPSLLVELVFMSTAGHAGVVDNINFLNCDDLDDSPDDAEEAADANDDHFPLISKRTITCTSSAQQVLNPVVNS